MIQIPMVDQNDFLVEAALDGVTYYLRFSWNSEAQIWVMGIQNSENLVLMQGVVLVPNVALLTQFRTLDLPAGEFVAYMDDDYKDVGRDSFLTDDAKMFYIPGEEYASL